MDEKYVKQLENAIKQMLTPFRGIPLKLVIESLSGHTIVPFNPDDPKDNVLLQKLVKVAKKSALNMNKVGIKQRRANEVGNAIESFVKNALIDIGYAAGIPKTTKGHQKATGYPDIEFKDEYDRINYLECKTYNIENINSTQRSFYLSPSDDFKVASDAHHFIISFEIIEESRGATFNIYKCNGWKLLSAEKLLVDVKHEFNSDNARMYQKELILAEGKM